MKVDEFKRLLQTLGDEEVLILKFGATWCKPCKKIKPLVEDIAKRLPANVRVYDVDIDESVELYLAFKSKKMIKGVPTMLAFCGERERDTMWYIPDELVSGADEGAICSFFENVAS